MVKRFFTAGILALVLLSLFVFPITVSASEPGKVVIGGSFILGDGEVLDEDLTILGGNAVLEEGSLVRGNIQILGGTLEVSGEVKGNILAAGGILHLNSTAVIDGDVTIAGAVLGRDNLAQVLGKVKTETDMPINLTGFNSVWDPFHWWLSSLWNIFWYVGLAFGLAALAVLVMMFFDKQTQRATQALVTQPTTSTGLGCLTALVLPFASIIFIITICLIPAVIVAYLILGVAITFGWIALGLEVGERLAKQMNQDWAPPFAAGVGTFILVLVGGLLNIIPFFGWVFTALISAAGLGAVLLTRFGMKDYIPAGQVAVLPSGADEDDEAEPGQAEVSQTTEQGPEDS